ncbi:MAG: PEGA domain-containing protein [Rikenellaceae bacterium]
MKKIFYVFIIALATVAYSVAAEPEVSLTFVEDSFVERNSGVANLTANFLESWPMNSSQDVPAALIRVKLENFSKSAAEKLQFSFASHCNVVRKESYFDSRAEIWLFVDPVAGSYIEAYQPLFNIRSNRYPLPDKLDSKGVYEITLKNRPSTTIAVGTSPVSYSVMLDGVAVDGVTPLQISDVSFGSHLLTLSNGGEIVRETSIDVSYQNVSFDYDLRHKRVFNITSEPSGAVLYIDGVNHGTTPQMVELSYQSYEIVALLNNLEKDSLTVFVGDNTPSELVLRPVKTRNFSILTTRGGNSVNTVMLCDGEEVNAGKASNQFRFNLPYGNYLFSAAYNGYPTSQRIRVNENSDSQYEIKIPVQNKVMWPWERDYTGTPWGISAAYVSKQWETTGEGLQFNTDYWGNYNKSLQGFQVGVFAQPNIAWGLGFNTGLFYEFYYSQDDALRDSGYYDEFVEHSLYIPAHLTYRIAFTEDVELMVQGGVGMNVALYGELNCTADKSYSAPMLDIYDKDYMPKRVNFAAEVGGSFRYKFIQVGALYSKGLTDHEIYASEGDYETLQNKFSVYASAAISKEWVEDWLDEIDDAQDVFGVSFSYINKQLVTRDGDGFQYNTHPFFLTEDKFLHGAQISFLWEPDLARIFALRTGLNFDMYFCTPPSDMGMSDYLFSEFDLGVPLHAAFRFPFTSSSYLSLFGGIGAEILLDASLDDTSTDSDDDNCSIADLYGNDGYPQWYNFSADIGLELRIGQVMVGFTYSRGLTNHNIYDDYVDDEGNVTTFKSFMRKMAYTFTWIPKY